VTGKDLAELRVIDSHLSHKKDRYEPDGWSKDQCCDALPHEHQSDSKESDRKHEFAFATEDQIPLVQRFKYRDLPAHHGMRASVLEALVSVGNTAPADGKRFVMMFDAPRMIAQAITTLITFRANPEKSPPKIRSAPQTTIAMSAMYPAVGPVSEPMIALRGLSQGIAAPPVAAMPSELNVRSVAVNPSVILLMLRSSLRLHSQRRQNL